MLALLLAANAPAWFAGKAPSRRAGAFGCTVPCNGLFSGCLAIRFYRLEGKACVNTSRRVCFAPVGACASTLYVAACAYIPLRACVFTPAAHHIVLRRYAGATRDTLLQRDKCN